MRDSDGHGMFLVDDLEYEFYSADKWVYLSQKTSVSSVNDLNKTSGTVEITRQQAESPDEKNIRTSRTKLKSDIKLCILKS